MSPVMRREPAPRSQPRITAQITCSAEVPVSRGRRPERSPNLGDNGRSRREISGGLRRQVGHEPIFCTMSGEKTKE